jgi:hypothetical protein
MFAYAISSMRHDESEGFCISMLEYTQDHSVLPNEFAESKQAQENKALFRGTHQKLETSGQHWSLAGRRKKILSVCGLGFV